MQTISEATQTMITNGRYTNPAVRLICDIDPPFAGVDTLMESASDPFFCEYENSLYMSVVKSTGIFIYSVNLPTKALTQVAMITAADVQNARFCYDGNFYYAVWENSVEGKVYYFDGTSTTKLATGTCPDIVACGAVIACFWINDGIYLKTPTTMAQLVIRKADDETFKGLRVFLMPDGNVLGAYIVQTSSQDEMRIETLYTSSKSNAVFNLFLTHVPTRRKTLNDVVASVNRIQHTTITAVPTTRRSFSDTAASDNGLEGLILESIDATHKSFAETMICQNSIEELILESIHAVQKSFGETVSSNNSVSISWEKVE
jgi:hypothetical protein